MSGSVVDLVLIVLALLFAVNGYRQGFVVGGLSFVGFFGGALLGIQLAPIAAEQVESPAARIALSLAIVFGIAIGGQALAAYAGSHIRRSIQNEATRVADDVGGAVVSVVAVLLVAWMVAAPLASSSLPWLAREVRSSAIVHGVDRVMPNAVRGVYDSLRDAVDTNGFPDVFSGLTPTDARPVDPPDPELAASPVVRRAHQSVVKVLGDAPSCARRIEGSGFVYARERVMTNAHVVAGTRRVQIEAGGERLTGKVVVYDSQRDLAVIYVKGLDAPPMQFAPQEGTNGQDAIVVGYPLDGPYRATAARVRDVRMVRGPNIYDSATVVREVYSIRSQVRSGNSGGPLLASDGTVLGVIFAAAADDTDTGYALTYDEAAPVADAGRSRTVAVATGACT